MIFNPSLRLAILLLLQPLGFALGQDRSALQILEANTIEDFDFGIRGLFTLGNEDAPLVLLEFSDYQCAQCSIFHEVIFPKIKSAFIDTGRLFYVALNHPQPSHPVANLAAEAAYCAGSQGRYWEMRDALFANSLYLDEAKISDLVRHLGLHPNQFEECLRNGTFAAQIDAEHRCSLRMDIKITPSFVLGVKKGHRVIDGELIEGAPMWSEFKRIINDRLKLENR